MVVMVTLWQDTYSVVSQEFLYRGREFANVAVQSFLIITLYKWLPRDLKEYAESKGIILLQENAS